MKNKTDQIISIKPNELSKVIVPKELYMFYEAEDIIKMGMKVKKGYYEIESFIFNISDNKIIKAYYNIQYLKDHPDKLV